MNNNRYFLITFRAGGSYGNIPISTKAGKFFNSVEIKKYLSDIVGCSSDSVIITNIFEFKSEQDYDDFNYEEVDTES